jgi:hypothetical protein
LSIESFFYSILVVSFLLTNLLKRVLKIGLFMIESFLEKDFFKYVLRSYCLFRPVLVVARLAGRSGVNIFKLIQTCLRPE